MEEEILELKEEIGLLREKVNILERKENNRKAYGYLKILSKIILIGVLAYGGYRAYRYVIDELPNIIEEKIKDLNPLKKFT